MLFLVLIISNSCSGGAGTSDTHAAKEQSTTTKGIELIPLYKTQIDVFNKGSMLFSVGRRNLLSSTGNIAKKYYQFNVPLKTSLFILP